MSVAGRQHTRFRWTALAAGILLAAAMVFMANQIASGAPVIQDITVLGSNMVEISTSVDGWGTFRLQRSPDLTPGSWEDTTSPAVTNDYISTSAPAGSTIVNILITHADSVPGGATYFYRVIHSVESDIIIIPP